MAITGLQRVSGKPRITPVNDAPLARTEVENLRAAVTRRAWNTPTTGARSAATAGPLSKTVAGSKVGGSITLKGGML